MLSYYLFEVRYAALEPGQAPRDRALLHRKLDSAVLHGPCIQTLDFRHLDLPTRAARQAHLATSRARHRTP